MVGGKAVVVARREDVDRATVRHIRWRAVPRQQSSPRRSRILPFTLTIGAERYAFPWLLIDPQDFLQTSNPRFLLLDLSRKIVCSDAAVACGCFIHALWHEADDRFRLRLERIRKSSPMHGAENNGSSTNDWCLVASPSTRPRSACGWSWSNWCQLPKLSK
jgi:hypothetical protein